MICFSSQTWFGGWVRVRNQIYQSQSFEFPTMLYYLTQGWHDKYHWIYLIPILEIKL